MALNRFDSFYYISKCKNNKKENEMKKTQQQLKKPKTTQVILATKIVKKVNKQTTKIIWKKAKCLKQTNKYTNERTSTRFILSCC